MRYREIAEAFESISPELRPFVALAQKYDNVEQFIRKTDGMDVLYRGHYGDAVGNNVFMTDYVGHASEYAGGAGGEGRVDAFAYDSDDVLYYDDRRFDEMRNAYRDLSDRELAAIYRGSVLAPHMSRKELATVKKMLRGDMPYSDVAGLPNMNDLLVPLLQAYARERGKNIIAFHGSDYADYGGQTEYVVGDISKLVDLRALYAKVRGG